MNKKQGVIGLVATVMIANAAFVDVRPVYAVENLNLAKGCTVNASSYEVNSTSRRAGEQHRIRQTMNGLKLI